MLLWNFMFAVQEEYSGTFPLKRVSLLQKPLPWLMTRPFVSDRIVGLEFLCQTPATFEVFLGTLMDGFPKGSPSGRFRTRSEPSLDSVRGVPFHRFQTVPTV